MLKTLKYFGGAIATWCHMLENEFAEKDVSISPQFRLNLDSMTQVIAEINSQLAGQFDLDDLVETAVRLTQTKLGYDRVTINILDSNKQKFCLRVEADDKDGSAVQVYGAESFSGLAYRALRRRTLLVVDDLAVVAPQYFDATKVPIRAEIHIPLEHQEEILGILSLGSIERNVFDQPDTVIALKILAAQIAVSMNWAYQYGKNQVPGDDPAANENIQSHVVQIQHLLPEIQSLGGSIRELFDKIVRGVVEGLGYTAAMLAVVDEKAMTLPVQALAYSNFLHHKNWDVVGKMLGVQIIGSYVSLVSNEENLGVQTYYTGRAKVTHDLYDMFRPAVSRAISANIQKATGIESCVSIPLMAEGKVVGMMYAGSQKEQISVTDLDELHFFVTNAAIAIQNSLNFDKLNRDLALREAHLSQLRRIERVITASLDLEDVLKHILNGAVELTRAASGQVVLVGRFASGLVRRVSYPQTIDTADVEPPGLQELINSRPQPDLNLVAQLIEVNNRNTLKVMEDGDNEDDYSVLAVPISLDNELVGVISIARQNSDIRKSETFNETSLDLLDQLAVQAAIAIRNAYQFKVEYDIRERLANVSQVVAMGDMASNMVHSINNWVGAIRADIKYLLRQYPFIDIAPEDFLDLFKDMLSNAESTLSMAENIKKPFQPLEQEPIDVNECITQALRDKRHELSNVIIIESLEPVPPVMATRQIELVFENLINNALYAMKDQVRGILRCVSRLSKDGQWIEVVIQDSGPGLSKSLKPTDIFKLGVSDKANGMGYGLWWSDTFLKRWGGRIFFVDNVKRGCKFLVRLPVLNGESSQWLK